VGAVDAAEAVDESFVTDGVAWLVEATSIAKTLL
jgi:hypothetical protein